MLGTSAAARAVDALVEVFAPGRALRRRYQREVLGRLGRHERSASYAAAQTNRMIGDWSPTDSDVNTIIGNSAANVRNRIRQLVRDFPYFSRAINVICDHVVGPGIIFQSRVRERTGKRPGLDRVLCQRIEDAFNFWADEADAAGRLHFYEIMELAKRQDVECGEFLIVATELHDAGRYVPYALQIYEPDWLTSYGARPLGGKNYVVDQGVEYHKATGRVVAYHFTDPDSYAKTVRIPAERVIHGFHTLRPGQLRGISPLVSAVLVAHDLGEYMDAEMDAAKMASKYLAFVKRDNPFAAQAGVSQDPDTGKPIEELENGIIEYLRIGEDIEIASNPRPGSNFPPFVRLVLCMLSVAAGVPYEMISGDYQGVNYSTLRSSRNDFAQQLRPVCVRHVRHFGQPTLRGFLDSAVLSGRLDLPRYFTDPSPYLRASWQPPGMESVDPLRETKARLDEVRTLLRSPQEIIRARGGDPEKVLAEIADFIDWAESAGLPADKILENITSTAVKNNPAAVAGGNGNGKKRSHAGAALGAGRWPDIPPAGP